MNDRERSALTRLLREHAARYPLMQPADAVKLLFQNEFGGGHLIADPQKSLARLREEYANTQKDAALPLAEDIGGGMVRVQLAALDEAEYPLEALNCDFVRSAREHTGDKARFEEKLALLRELTAQGAFSFDAAALEGYLTDYAAAGYPPVSHSARYHDAYAPAYRVLERAVSYPLLLRELTARAGEGRRVLLAIDGRCASGKSTLAAELHERFGWSVIHMDDFFLRPEQRTPERYAAPGENIDHERFLEEVLLPLHRGELPRYRPFDCHELALCAPVAVADTPVVIVEGSYACHPTLWRYYDLRVFLTVEPEEQMRRIRARNGDYAEVFREKWIPLEERYFAACTPQIHCEYRLER